MCIINYKIVRTEKIQNYTICWPQLWITFYLIKYRQNQTEGRQLGQTHSSLPETGILRRIKEIVSLLKGKKVK